MYKIRRRKIVDTINNNNFSYSFNFIKSNNLSPEEEMFCTLVQNISKTDDDKMAKMYQHLTRILYSFSDGYTSDGNNYSVEKESDGTKEISWDQLELKLNE
jgi:hypothetical protein